MKPENKISAAQRTELWKEEKRVRVAELLADPAKHKYAALVERGEQWYDEQIAYFEDPDRTATCPHLRPIEHAMRLAGVAPKVIVKRWLPNYGRSMNIKADCCINEPELRRQFAVAESVHYQEGYSPERHPQDNPWAKLSCSLCDSYMDLVHSEWPRKDTRWFPAKPA